MKKRILILNYEFPPLGGGAANATYFLLKEYAKDKDLEVDLVTSSVDKFRVEEFSDNIKVHYLNIGKKGNFHYQSKTDLVRYAISARIYAGDLLRIKKHDMIHAFFGIPCGWVARYLYTKYRVPYIVSLRGSDVPFYNERFKMLDKYFFKSLSKAIWRDAKHVIANSEGLRELALSSHPNQEIGVIYNGVDVEQFRPIEKTRTNILKLISTGRLIERKGYKYLIEALKGVENVHLTLVGDGNIRDQLEKLAIENGVQVSFLGKKDRAEVISLLQQADVFVLPSLNEGMSNSVLEAMACGLPIISTDTGGSKELIKENGFIVSKESPEEIKNAILEYQNNPELILQHAQNSRDLAEGMSWESMSDKYKELYELA